MSSLTSRPTLHVRLPKMLELSTHSKFFLQTFLTSLIFRVSIALICGYLLGFADACWNTQIFTYLISNYPQQSAQAFSLFKFWQSLLTCAAFFYGTVFNLNIQLLMLTIGSIVACFCFKLAEQLSVTGQRNLTPPEVHAD